MNIRIVFRALMALAMLVALSGAPAGTALAAGSAVPKGTYTSPSGEWLIVRQVNWPNKTVNVLKKWLNAGESMEIFDHPANDRDHSQSAWRGYPTDQFLAHGLAHELWEVACLDDWAKGFSVTNDGSPYNAGSCREPQFEDFASAVPAPAPVVSMAAPAPAPSGGSITCANGKSWEALRPGAVLPTGHAAIVRTIIGGDVKVVTYQSAPAGLKAGHAFDGVDDDAQAIWHHCDGQPWEWMDQDALNEVHEIICGQSLGFMPRTLTLNGQDVRNQSC